MLNDVGGVQGPQPIQPDPPQTNPKIPPASRPPRTDAAEISQEARLLDKLSKTPDLRQDKVDELRRMIGDGSFETPERLEGTVARLLDELLGR